MVTKKILKLANATQLTNNLWIGGELDQVNHELAQRQLDELMPASINSSS